MPMFPISHFGGSIYQTKQYVINLLSSMGFDSSSYKIVCINSYVQVDFNSLSDTVRFWNNNN